MDGSGQHDRASRDAAGAAESAAHARDAGGRRPSGLLLWLCGIVVVTIALAMALPGGVSRRMLRLVSIGTEPVPIEPAGSRAFRPTTEQLASLTIGVVGLRSFCPEDTTEGKIAVNDDRNTPVFTPYAGRAIRILTTAGEDVRQSQVLFTVEAADMVQALNDDQAALNARAKARALVQLNEVVAKRQEALFKANAGALKDWQSAQNDLIGSQSDLRTAETALQAARNKLKILGKTDEEIAQFEHSGSISPETPIKAPLAGTIVQRKVGPGQYLAAGSDPPFVIGDLSTVWLIANVRESSANLVRKGQLLDVKVLALPGRTFEARIKYMAASLDPATRRLAVRAEIPNPDRDLKPEMFATFGIVLGPAVESPAVPRDAIVYEGRDARVWIVNPDGTVEARTVKLGLADQEKVQVLSGLAEGDRIVTRGALFIDRAATGDRS